MAARPIFWDNSDAFLGALLSPLGWLFHAYTKRARRLRLPYRAGVPVLLVGNHVVGGGGKTPLVSLLAKVASDMGYSPAIILRAYPLSIKSPRRVDLRQDTVRTVGDEALVHALHSDRVWVCRDRVAATKAALANGADFVISDDGLQSGYLHADFVALTVPPFSALGNGRLYPAGPLREPLVDAIKRSDAVIWRAGSIVPQQFKEGKLQAFVKYSCVLDEPDRRYLAFSGIADPQQFFDSASRSAKLVLCRSFPDHHVFTKAELEKMQRQAEDLDAKLLCTSKDAARISGKWRKKIAVADLRIDLKPSIIPEQIIKETVNTHRIKNA